MVLADIRAISRDGVEGTTVERDQTSGEEGSRRRQHLLCGPLGDPGDPREAKEKANSDWAWTKWLPLSSELFFFRGSGKLITIPIASQVGSRSPPACPSLCQHHPCTSAPMGAGAIGHT
ncbi:unnamed protein product [Merluccius merluccius]